MEQHFRPRLPRPAPLCPPVPIDPAGSHGPTTGQARGPRWRRSTPRLYVPTEAPATVEQRILEQSRRLPPGGGVGGWASLRMHRAAYFDGLAPDGHELPVPLLLPPGRQVRDLPGSVAVRPPRMPPIEVVHGVPCVRPAHAVVMSALRQPHVRAAVLVLDMALAAGVTTLEEVHTVTETMGPCRGLWQLRAALGLADPRSRSPRETWMRLVWVLDARLGRPRCNWEVLDLTGRSLGSPDLLHPELPQIAEYDGAAHRGASRHRRDEERKQVFRNHALEVVTVVGRGPGDEQHVAGQLQAAAARAAASPWPTLVTARERRLWT